MPPFTKQTVRVQECQRLYCFAMWIRAWCFGYPFDLCLPLIACLNLMY